MERKLHTCFNNISARRAINTADSLAYIAPPWALPEAESFLLEAVGRLEISLLHLEIYVADPFSIETELQMINFEHIGGVQKGLDVTIQFVRNLLLLKNSLSNPSALEIKLFNIIEMSDILIANTDYFIS